MENNTHVMKFIIQDFIRREYKDINIYDLAELRFVNELGYKAIYNPRRNDICFSIEEWQSFGKDKDYELIIITLLHELIHFAMYKLDMEWLDYDTDFEKELLRVGANTNYTDEEEQQLQYTLDTTLTYEELEEIRSNNIKKYLNKYLPLFE